ncbi:MAG: immunoglobulin domain-containing protein [Bacteroidia bacterium]|nr:immunoglobulin domain-containing protein [Bacteroidia bacterium]
MRATTLVLIFFLSLASGRNAYAQWINISPNNSDFCTNTSITYTSGPPAPGNDIMWEYGDYSNYASLGIEQVFTLGYGTVLNMNSYPMTNCPGGTIRAIEIDALGNYIQASVVHLLSSVGNLTIPVVAGTFFGSCYSLSVPPCFDPNSTIPWGTPRWAMWYKNGVATGETSYLLSGPLSDSAWYQYKTVLTCGDTLRTDPYYFWQPSNPVITAQGPTTFCTGDTLLIQGSSAITIDRWTKNGITISGSSGKTSIKVTESGTYVMVGKTSSGSGGYCYRNSNAVLVTVNPGAFITSPVSVACNGDSIQLSCTSAPSYVWKRNGVAMAGAVSQSIWVKQSGTYQVNTSGLTCNSSPSKQITFYANPTVSLNPAGTLTLCEGSAESLTASGNNISGYQWYRNGTALPGGDTPALYITKAGKYKCVVSNLIGCTKTSSNVTVSNASTASLPARTLVLQPDTSGIDAYITCAFGNFGNNFGGAPTIEVSNWYKHFRTAERGYLKFDLSALPPNSPLVSASLRLWVDTVNEINPTLYPPNSLFFKRNTQNWTESNVTWNSSIDSTDFQCSSVACSTLSSKSYLNLSILNLVRHWSYVPSQHFGMLLHLDELKRQTWIRLASSDDAIAAHRPKLTLEYYFADIIAGGSTALCSGGSVTFSTNSGPYTYQWLRNGQVIAGASASSYTATVAGDYQVILTAASGCSVTSVAKTVTVNAPPAVSISPAGAATFCQGSTLLISADSLPGYSFQWRKNNVNIAGAVFSTYTVSQSGTYSVVVTSPCGVTSTASVVCTKINNPAASISAGGPTTFCAGQSVVLTANAFAGVTYQWRRNGIDLAGATAQSYTATLAGNYTVRESANGCSKTSNAISVVVNCREGDFGAPANQTRVGPVPAAGAVRLELEGDFSRSGVRFELLDLHGRALQMLPATGNTTILYRGDLAAGIYLLRTFVDGNMVDEDKLIFTQD